MNRDLSDATWRKSSRSGQSGNCVEIAELPGIVGVRDSKDKDGGVLTFGTAAWSSFIDDVKAGRFDI